jgi:Cu/Ag efflux protein CusF
LQQDNPRPVKQSGRVCFALALLLALALPSCIRKRTAEETRVSRVSGTAAAVETTSYNGVGVVKATDMKRPSVEIDHEEIKGLMPAMTMEFYVKDRSLLAGIKPGDRIEFTIENGVGGEKITAIRRL